LFCGGFGGIEKFVEGLLGGVEDRYIDFFAGILLWPVFGPRGLRWWI
jgi:hypothetical protein